MEQNYVTQIEHKEFAKRMEAEHDRQNHRLNELEQTVKQIAELTVAIEKMAINMEQMLQEQKEQGRRMEIIEGRDGEKWRTISSYILTAVVGAVVCYVLTKVGL